MRALLKGENSIDLHPGDEERSSRVRLQLAIILSMSLFFALSALGTFFVNFQPTFVLSVIGLMLLLNLVNYYLIKQGKDELVSYLMVGELYLFVTTIVISRGSFLIPAAGVYFYLIVVAGALFGKRGVWWSSACCSLTIAALSIAEIAGILPKPDLSINASHWIVYTALFGMIGSISYLAGDLTRQALLRNKKTTDERQLAEEALRLANERYRLIAENTHDVIWVIDVQSQRFTYVSPSVFKLRGYSVEEVMARPTSDALTPESAAKVQTLLEMNISKVMSGQPAPSSIVELDQPCKDGSIVPTEVIATLVWKDDRLQVVGISRDISERKRDEAQIRKMQANLERAQAITHMGSWELDLAAHREVWSKEMYTLYNFDPADGPPDALRFAQKIHPDDVSKLIAAQKNVLMNGTAESQIYRVFPTPGEERVFETSIFPTLSADNQILQITGTVIDITERYHAQAQLHEKEQSLSAILNATLETVLLIDLDGTVLLANDYACQRLKTTSQQLIGKNIYDFLPPDLAEARKKHIEQVAQTRQMVSFEDIRGSIYFLNNIYPIFDEQGNLNRVAIYGQDHTERKLAENALRASELRFSKAFLSSPDSIIISALKDGRYLEVNDSFLRDTGYTREEVIGHSSIELDIWATPADRQRLIVTLNTQGSVRNLEAQYRRKDGTIRDAAISAEILDLGPGEKHLLAVVHDITEQKKAEHDRLFRQAQLEKVLQLGKIITAIPALPDCLKTIYHLVRTEFPFDRAGLYLINNTNATARGVFGTDLNGHMQSEDGITIQLDSMPKVYEALMQKGVAKIEDFQAQYNPTPGSNIAGVKEHINVVAWAGDQPVGMISVDNLLTGRPIRDVDIEALQLFAGFAGLAIANAQLHGSLEQRIDERTLELRASRDELAQANVALEKASRMKDEFLASMSHELRTPLTGILGLSEALQLNTYGALNSQQNKALENIESSGRHLLELINDILDLSKIEADKFDLQIEPCNVLAICQASLQLTKGMAQKKNQKVSFSAEVTSAVVNADPRRFKQMLVNLLSNAVKFTPDGGALGLEVLGSEVDQMIHLTVWDNGIGISTENLGKLFKPFTQLDSRLSRQCAGTGLGLSLVARLAELHGGRVTVQSTLGQGSRFTLSLPWKTNESEAVERSERTMTKWIHSCLVVEDTDMHRRQLGDYLQRLNIECSFHHQGQGALEAAVAAQPDIILLDILLPDLPGEQVMRSLKSDPRTSSIPVVISSITDERRKYQELGAAGYLVKPYRLADLAEALQRIQAPGPAKPAMSTPQGDKGTVLFTDDDETILDIMTDYLLSCGYQVVQAHSGKELIELAPTVRADVILTDIQMPGIDGLQAIRHIRASSDPNLANVPIVAITALAMPGDEQLCLAAGANRYISKPLSLNRLAALVDELIRK